MGVFCEREPDGGDLRAPAQGFCIRKFSSRLRGQELRVMLKVDNDWIFPIMLGCDLKVCVSLCLSVFK